MFVPRLFSSIVLLIIFFLMFLIKSTTGLCVFVLLGSVLSAAGVHEFSNLLKKMDIGSFSFIPEIFSVILFVSVIADRILSLDCFLEIAAVVLFLIYCWLRILFSGNNRETVVKAVGSVTAFMLIAVPLNFVTLVYINGYFYSYTGVYLILFLVLVTKFGDIGAYVIGTLSSKRSKGNHKIIPSISPKKSWEGTIGGFIVSIATAGIIAWDFHFPIFSSLVIGAFLFVGGFAGDLSESVLKRVAGIKDSGSLIPGIGGALDLLDSLLINAPMFYILLLMAKII